MAIRKPYERRLNVLSAWTLKAIGLIIAGAATVMIALTISKAVSAKTDSSPGGKFVGVRHEAASVAASSRAPAAVPTAGANQDLATASPSARGQEQEGSIDTVVQNGITVVSPRLLVPVIDIDSLQTNAADESVSSTKRKRGRYAKRSHSHRHVRIAANRWPAYGLMIR